MALKPQRHEFKTDTSFFMNEVAERGGVAVISTVGSGEAYDQSAALVTYQATPPSGTHAMGILMNDMVSIDQTRQHINWHKNEVALGSKVTLLQQGFVVTNHITPGLTIAVHDNAYASMSGYLTNTTPAVNPEQYPLIGRFLSTKNAEGFAKVEVNMPLPRVLGN